MEQSTVLIILSVTYVVGVISLIASVIIFCEEIDEKCD